jgi:RNA polymerase sigma-70 factor (ECF subfamily)
MSWLRFGGTAVYLSGQGNLVLGEVTEKLLRLLEEFGPGVRACFIKVTSRGDLSDDLLQELFLRLCDSEGLAQARSRQRYLLRAAINLALDWRKHNSKQRAIEGVLEDAADQWDSTVDALILREDFERVLAAMEGLSAAQRELITLRYFDGLSFEEIASRLKSTRHRVRALCSKAIAALRKAEGQQAPKLRTLVFDTKVRADGKLIETRRQMIGADGQFRTDHSDGRYRISKRTGDSFAFVEVDPGKRCAYIAYGFPQDQPRNPNDVIRKMRDHQEATQIGARRIGGRSCRGLRIELELDPGNVQRMSLWLDAKTNLPVYSRVLAKWKDKSGNLVQRISTSSNFRYDVPLDDSLFDLTPPQGFEVTSEGSPRTQETPQWPPEKLVIHVGEGIGPARFGMSPEQVADQLGEPEKRGISDTARVQQQYWERYAAKFGMSPEQLADQLGKSQKRGIATVSQYWEYYSQGITLSFSGDTTPRLKQVTCRGWNNNFVSRNFPGRTTEGIALGSSPTEVRQAFGDPESEQPIQDGIGAFDYFDKRLRIGFFGGKVQMLTTWRSPSSYGPRPSISE